MKKSIQEFNQQPLSLVEHIGLLLTLAVLVVRIGHVRYPYTSDE